MAKVIVIQHVSFEILGTMNALFKDQGIRIKYVNFSRTPDKKPSVKGYDGLVILGGPMNVDDTEYYPHLQTEIAMIQEAMVLDIPILGICLGAQLIAKANKAKVCKNPVKEIGWYDVTPTKEGADDTFFKHFAGTQKIFQWHGDTFAIPANAVKLAASETCANQAFKINHNIYGFQFHLEVDEALIHRWLTTPIHVEELKKLKGIIEPDEIKKKTITYIENSKALSKKVFGEFIHLIGHKPKPKIPPLR